MNDNMTTWQRILGIYTNSPGKENIDEAYHERIIKLKGHNYKELMELDKAYMDAIHWLNGEDEL